MTVTIEIPQPGGQVQWTFGSTSGTCPTQCVATAPPNSRFEASAAHDEHSSFAGFPTSTCGTDALRCLIPFATSDTRVVATFLAQPTMAAVAAQRSFTLSTGSLRQSLVAVDAGVAIAGLGAVDFGAGPRTSAFFATFGSNAALVGSRALSTRGTFEVNDVDSNGTLDVVAGRCTGGTSLQADGGAALPVGPCVGAFDSTTGQLVWARGWTGTGSVSRVAVAPTGLVAIAGVVSGTFDLGTGPLSARGGGDFFFGLLSSTGSTVMARRGGRTYEDAPGGVAFAANGDAIFTAQIYGGPATFETINLTQANFQTASFIARYSPAGLFLGGRGISGQVLTSDALADGQGGVYFVGEYSNTVDFGGITRNAGPGLTSNGVVVKYDSNFAAQWLAEGYGEPTRAAIAANGTILLVGSFYRYLRWGQGYVLGDTVGTSTSGFALKLTPSGGLAWVKRVSTGGAADAVASGGSFWIVGNGRTLVGLPTAAPSPYLVAFPR